MAEVTLGARTVWEYKCGNARLAVRARSTFRLFLSAYCTPKSDVDAAEMAFGELLANVVQHAPGPIVMVVRSDGRGNLTLTVRDSGNCFEPETQPLSVVAESGRGLFMIRTSCGPIVAEMTAAGCEVTISLPVTPKDS